MKVYVAYMYETYGVDSGGDILGVFSSKEKAVARLKEASSFHYDPSEYTYYAYEYVIDDPHADMEGDCEVNIV